VLYSCVRSSYGDEPDGNSMRGYQKIDRLTGSYCNGGNMYAEVSEMKMLKSLVSVTPTCPQ